MPLQSKYPLVPVEEALDLILDVSRGHRKGAVLVNLEESVGFVLAEDVVVPRNLPPFPASIKDGYALRSSDGLSKRSLLKPKIHAGTPLEFLSVGPGEAAYIATGAPLPPGADAVVMVENVEVREDESIDILCSDISPGLDVRPVGSDLKEGSQLLPSSHELEPADLGLLATCGISQVKVWDKPVVGVLSTGDELVDHNESNLEPHQIRDSNRPMLVSLLQPYAKKIIDLGIIRDEEQVVASLLHHASTSKLDVLVTSGGVSMGKKDLVKPLLERLGTIHFGRVLMKPGKPFTFASVKLEEYPMLVFALPGNPVSSGVTALLGAIPSLKCLAGSPRCMWPRIRVHIDSPVTLDMMRPEYHRVKVEWHSPKSQWIASTTGRQQSSRLQSMHDSNAFLELPAAGSGSKILEQGAEVSALLYGDVRVVGPAAPRTDRY